jgi:hypothetical protein
MRWVASDDCKVKGPGRALLWVIAYHADRDTGECWVGQRRLARESGFARSTVQLALDQLFDDLVLEPVEDARGPRPERYRIAPALVEGEAFGTGLVEGEASVSGTIEGDAVVGEVIHNPGASGPTAGPQGSRGNFLVDRSWPPSGPIHGPDAALVDRSADVTGPFTGPLSSENVSQGSKQGFELQGGNQVLNDASSAADAAGVVEACEPPPVDEGLKEHLRRRGLGRKDEPKPIRQVGDATPQRSRDEQLAELRQQYPDDFKSAENGEANA